MIVGRLACPYCSFPSAHVKRRAERHFAYFHCPDCGFVVLPRSGMQERLLLRAMRPDGAPTPPYAANPIVVPSVDRERKPAKPAHPFDVLPNYRPSGFADTRT